ncbi:winged helix-turn-helix domain-containing protein [Providencia sneebia]|uniref:OmpR/PhoB-type domain-containing protein n=1 Tax=Providencia sneebia DSM 19967 TaxID=1141660 RepID=K8WV47_9GAMM|nr:winged helix-turn-helix domain-containing protein [Providencia sneebia]EKT60070.1 hypothetical protein OO7_04529 [Providencia sneebia DSM 19967]
MKDYTLGKGVKFNLIKCTISSEHRDITLGSREAKLLELFCENPNQLLDKTLMTDTVWGAVIVSETSLTKAISNLRKALNHFQDLVCEIKTIPKEGYVFIFENKCDSLNIEENILPEKQEKPLSFKNDNQEKHINNEYIVNKKINEHRKSFSLLSLTIFSSLVSSAATVTLFNYLTF